jgi:hypothetical protein
LRENRKTILQLGPALEAIEPMAFWEAAPPDELASIGDGGIKVYALPQVVRPFVRLNL